MIVYNFNIFHLTNKRNSINNFSKRSNYEKILSFNTRLLSTLQNKLIFSTNKHALTKNEKINSNFLIISNILANVCNFRNVDVTQISKISKNLNILIFV